ncbi:MAG: glutathione peroxidase [Candidatus Izemoplasmatales bacterium]|nr:glutathione peroxidase [Candidatus Izemoplasmatales bacterium]
MSIYDYTVQTTEGTNLSLSQYKGKVLLIVNTATHCGFTPQYEGLESLYQEFSKKGFEILDFPCNQFMNQAPENNQDLASFCQIRYHTTFQTFAKLQVNGKNTHPLYRYLKQNEPKKKGLLSMLKGSRIPWNFTKFLVDRNGRIIARFAPTVTPETIQKEIQSLIEEQ